MTIEQKAKCYDEALKVAKKLYEQGTITESLAYIFPELKESGDEKTRKRIIALVNAHGQGMYKDDMLAWLEKIEKQGEQKPQRMVSAEAKEALYDKPACAWSEEDEHRVKDTIYFLDTAKKHYASTVELDACIDWLKSLKNRVLPQPKQEWSEEDEKMCQETIDWFEKKCFPYALENENPARESIKWLKSLKQRIKGE